MGKWDEQPLSEADEADKPLDAAEPAAETSEATIGEHDPNAGDEQAEATVEGQG